MRVSFALALASSVQAVYLGIKYTGHINLHLSALSQDLATNCRNAELSSGIMSCQQAADSNNITLNAFLILNPSMDCTLPLQDKTLFCVPDDFAPDVHGLPTLPNATVTSEDSATDTTMFIRSIVATETETSVAASTAGATVLATSPVTSVTSTTVATTLTSVNASSVENAYIASTTIELTPTVEVTTTTVKPKPSTEKPASEPSPSTTEAQPSPEPSLTTTVAQPSLEPSSITTEAPPEKKPTTQPQPPVRSTTEAPPPPPKKTSAPPPPKKTTTEPSQPPQTTQPPPPPPQTTQPPPPPPQTTQPPVPPPQTTAPPPPPKKTTQPAPPPPQTTQPPPPPPKKTTTQPPPPPPKKTTTQPPPPPPQKTQAPPPPSTANPCDYITNLINSNKDASAGGVVNMHNAIRQYVSSVRGESLPAARWDDAVASQATVDAQWSVAHTSCQSGGLAHNPDFGITDAKNLGWSNFWYAMYQFVTYDDGGGSECQQYFNSGGAVMSHFTNMMHGGSRVGCGAGDCPGGQFGPVIGCDYAP